MNEQDRTVHRADYCTAFLKAHAEHRFKIREFRNAVNNNFLTAHQFALSAVISYQNRIQGQEYDAINFSIR